MSRIIDLLTNARVITWCGIPAEDFIAAMRVIGQSNEIGDKRILSCRVAHPGDVILVCTGFAHGGCTGGGAEILLERDGSGWQIAEVQQWRS
jgi:hypothetical protein